MTAKASPTKRAECEEWVCSHCGKRLYWFRGREYFIGAWGEHRVIEECQS